MRWTRPPRTRRGCRGRVQNNMRSPPQRLEDRGRRGPIVNDFYFYPKRNLSVLRRPNEPGFLIWDSSIGYKTVFTFQKHTFRDCCVIISLALYFFNFFLKLASLFIFAELTYTVYPLNDLLNILPHTVFGFINLSFPSKIFRQACQSVRSIPWVI